MPDATASSAEPVDGSATPMELATKLVQAQRTLNGLKARVKTTADQIQELQSSLLTAIEDGKFPQSSNVEGASVHRKSQLWASPADGDHERLTAILDGLGEDYEHLLPTTVNSQTLSGFIREKLADAPLIEDRPMVNEDTGEVVLDDDGDPVMQTAFLTLEERARLVLPASLCDALKLTDKVTVNVTGAGSA